MSTLRVSNIEAKADVSSPTVDEKIKFTNSSGNVLFYLDGKTSGITTVGINTTGNTFTVNNTTGDVSFSGSVTSSGVSTFSSDVSIADSIIHTGDTDTAIRFPAADTFTVETAGSERLRITSDGTLRQTGESSALGQGTSVAKITHYTIDPTTPGGVGDVTTLETTSATSNGSDYRFRITKREGSGGGSCYLDLGGNSDGSISFGTNTSGSGTERLRISSNGKVGIGSAIPTEILDVSGTGDMKMVVHTEDSGAGNNAGIRIATGDGYKWLLQVGDATTSGGLRIYQETSGSNGERLRITSSGDITTSGLTGITTQTSNVFYESNSRIVQIDGGDSQGWLALGSSRSDTNAYVGGINFVNRYGQQDNHRFLGYIRLKSTHVSGGSYGTNILQGQLEFATKPSSDTISTTTPDMVISQNGNVEISNGNLVFSTSGTGIDFSATSDGSGTTTSELLDDYEEGTFTPTVTPSSGSFTTASYGDRVGMYRKVGNMVYIQIRTNFNSFNRGSASGNVTITGLPYSALSSANANYLNVGQCNNWSGGTPPSGAIVGGTTVTLMEGTPNSGYNNDFTDVSDMGSTSENRIQLSGWYIAS